MNDIARAEAQALADFEAGAVGDEFEAEAAEREAGERAEVEAAAVLVREQADPGVAVGKPFRCLGALRRAGLGFGRLDLGHAYLHPPDSGVRSHITRNV